MSLANWRCSRRCDMVLSRSQMDVKQITNPLQKFMGQIGDVARAAAKINDQVEEYFKDSPYISHAVVDRAYRQYEGVMNKAYSDFIDFRDAFDALAKQYGVSTRKARGTGKKHISKNIDGMNIAELGKDARRVIVDLKRATSEIAGYGGAVFDALQALSRRDRMSDEEAKAVVQEMVKDVYWPFRDAVYLCFGLVGGIIKRINARAALGAGRTMATGGASDAIAPARSEDVGLMPSGALIQAVLEDLHKGRRYGGIAPVGVSMEEEQFRGLKYKVEIPDGRPVYARDKVEAALVASRYPGSVVVENRDEKFVIEDSRPLEKRLPWANDPEVPDI